MKSTVTDAPSPIDGPAPTSPARRAGAGLLAISMVIATLACRHRHIARLIEQLAADNFAMFTVIVLAGAFGLILLVALLRRALVGRLPRRSFRLAAIILAVAAGWIVTEGAFRGLDISADPPGAQHLDTLKVDNHLNALGIREPWDTLDDRDSRLRIAFLGDSFTYGESVERHDTFCHLLQAMLADTAPAGVITINLGIPGTGPAEQRELYRTVGAALKPDMVVHVIYLNDIAGDLQPLVARVFDVRDDQLWVGSASRVLQFLERQIRYRLAWQKTLAYFRGGRDPRDRQRRRDRFITDIRAIRRDVTRDGADYVVVIFPWLCRLDDYLLGDVHQWLDARMNQLHVPCLDLLDVFKGRDARTVRISDVNEHPNPTGHRLAATRMAPFIRARIKQTGRLRHLHRRPQADARSRRDQRQDQ